MAKNKTTENENSVSDYIASIVDEKKRKDFSAIVTLIEKQTRVKPKMWGTAIVGFGSYHYVYESGREGDAPCFGMAARANAITLYLGANFENRDVLLTEFGKYKSGKGCVYIQKLEDIDIGILVKMVKNSMAHRKKHNLD
jgi:hypothetical protein